MIDTTFLTAGHAIFTVEVAEHFRKVQALLGNEFHEHYTYRIERVKLKASADGKFPARVAFFVSSLTGPDNTQDYTYLGEFVPATGAVKLTKKSAFPETATRVRVARRVLAAIVEGRGADIEKAGWNVRHCGFCGRCGALLTVPESVESGYGPECVKSTLGMSLAKWKKAQDVAAKLGVA